MAVEINCLRYSHVILANDHNVSIMTKDYLVKISITSHADIKNFAHTPVFSMVDFGHGYQMVLEPKKLQVTISGDKIVPENTNLVELTLKYLNSLPVTPYKALGVNFNAQAIVQENDEVNIRPLHPLIIRDLGNFIPYADNVNINLGLKLTFPWAGRPLTLTFDPAPKEQGKINVNLNYHVESGDLNMYAEELQRIPELFGIFNESVVYILERRMLR